MTVGRARLANMNEPGKNDAGQRYGGAPDAFARVTGAAGE